MKTLTLIAIAMALATTVSFGADMKENWSKQCASCHGKDGKGETKAGKKAEVKDLTDAKYQGAFTDDQAFTRVKEGYKEEGKERMKPFKEKLTDAEIKELIAFVRTLKK